MRETRSSPPVSCPPSYVHARKFCLLRLTLTEIRAYLQYNYLLTSKMVSIHWILLLKQNMHKQIPHNIDLILPCTLHLVPNFISFLI